MNARAQTRESDSQGDLLKSANFEPVFDQDGNIVDIRELKISTDRRGGMAAMRELIATNEPGDNVLGADGWTGKQRRILSTPAPLAAHYLRSSKKWDAKTGMMRDAAMILLPTEVIWTLFETLFEGQYSVTVTDTFQEDEEVVPVGNDHMGEQADDAPGRRFYARATVRISIHLPGIAVPREYEGVGVSYGQLRTDKTGNIYAINSERRTVDKGAIQDAKREALSNIGRVFRRAFEDGDDMVEHIERLLLGKIHDMNRPAIHRTASRENPVPAPQRRVAAPKAAPKSDTPTQDASKSDTEPKVEKQEKADTAAPVKSVSENDTVKPEEQEEAPKVTTVSVKIPNAPDRIMQKDGFLDAFIDIMFETCVTGSEAQKIVTQNADILDDLVEDKSQIEEVIASMGDQPEDEIPDFSIPEAASKTEAADQEGEDALRIEVEGKSGKAVLAEFKEALDKAKTVSMINAIIKVNTAAVRKMTPKQMTQFTEYRAEREKAINS